MAVWAKDPILWYKLKVMNRENSYESIMKSRGLKDYPYIRKFILGNETFDKPFVFGAGTSAGKTLITIVWLELFYLNRKNKGLKTLIFPSSTVVLRDNFAEALREFNPSFTYCICESKEDIKSAIKAGCDVIVTLPQTACRNTNLFNKFYNFILDEAHQWYFQTTISNIVKKIKPTNQILLTGTPSPFIAKGDKFGFQFVPVMELFELGKVSNVKIEVVSSSYDFRASDYSYYETIKKGVNLHSKAEESLLEVCKEMMKKLRNPIKGYESINNFTGNSIGKLFDYLDKTIIFCHSKKQADKFYKVLSNIKGLEGKVLVSHSESDKQSLEFNNFKEQPIYKILIAVDRGKLGFSMDELFNIVDFTLTQNLNMLLQMYGRLLRLSKTNKEKIFYKVGHRNMAPYFVDLMTAMLCLTKYEWYSEFNGRNMNGIIIPKVTISKRNAQYKNVTNGVKKTTNKLHSLVELGIPIDLNLFNTNIQHSYNGKFVTVAETTLAEVKSKFYGKSFNINQRLSKSDCVSFEDAKIICKSNNITSALMYQTFRKNNPNLKLPSVPKNTYYDKWINWSDFLGTTIIASQELYKYRLSFKDAKTLIQSNNIKKVKDYSKFRKKSKELEIILPAHPDEFYKSDWKDWSDFLGTIIVANQNKKYLDLSEAKEFLKGKNFDIHTWKAYTKSEDFPDFLPKDVYTVYGKDKNWKGLRDLFGTESNWNGPYRLK